MSFGTRLRELREDHDLTQKEIAAVISVSPRMVSFYESGEHFPRDESILFKLADYFHVSTDYLLGYSNVYFEKEAQALNELFCSLPQPAQKNLLDYAAFLHERYGSKK